MRGFSFDQIMAMSEAERQAFRKQLHGDGSDAEPVALSAERIEKMADYAGCDFGTALCTVMKHDPNQYALYRQQRFRRVNS